MRGTTLSRQIAACGLASITLIGCAASTPAPTPTLIPFETMTLAPPPVSTTVEQAEVPGVSACSHLLWPLGPGAFWRYSVSGYPGIETLTISYSEANGAPMLSTESLASPINCAEGRLDLLPPPGLGLHPVFAHLTRNRTASGSYLTEPGALLPLGTGANWDYEFYLGGSLNDFGTTLDPASSRAILQSQISGIESISTNLGQFEALHIQQTWLLELRFNGPDGNPATLLGVQQSRLYLVEGLGPLRYVIDSAQINSSAGVENLPAPITLELTEFRAP